MYFEDPDLRPFGRNIGSLLRLKLLIQNEITMAGAPPQERLPAARFGIDGEAQPRYHGLVQGRLKKSSNLDEEKLKSS